MTNDRFDRSVRFFGKQGQEKLAAVRATVIGIGGLGTHVVQQLALLGVGHLSLVDNEELADSDRNRYVGARHDDPVPGTPKVAIGQRIVEAIDSDIRVEKVQDSLVSESAFGAVIHADWVFGCLDNEGARLVLNELCAAYRRPYIDLASDIISSESLQYGGRVCVAWDGKGCIVCHGVLDMAEAQADLAGSEGKRHREALYGVTPDDLERTGPSVVSLNGVIASLGVTEFMLAATGVRTPYRLATYYGNMGRVAVSMNQPAPDCYYCDGIRGKRDTVDVQRYIRDDVGAFLR